MERVLRNSNKVVISGKGITAPVILPPDVFRPRGSGEMSVQAPPPATSQGGAPRVQPQSGTQQ
jgi:membrane protease subunit HflK